MSESPRKTSTGEQWAPPPTVSVEKPRVFKVVFTRRTVKVNLRKKKGQDDTRR